ncbi:hypothetical protein ACFY0F_31135 [Streptomyces sp. NPDC001544]|uniref:hypothetical protein n=1 Tax=Streptomyces sp. NPDC001544 TaxID=3364584 RepID=UPI00367600A9
MRLCTSLSLCLAAAVVVLGPVGVAHGREAGVDCAGAEARDFPLSARIHGGPTSYEAGGGFGTWYLDLVNTTDRACTAVHPVVVLVDDKRALKPGQARMEFYDGPRAHPVHFESTDENELVGAFDDGFPGFAVGPRKTVSVKVRLTVTSDAVPNVVTAKAAVVERRGDDGEWLGESEDYRFGIDTEPDTEPTEPDPHASDTPAATLTPDPTLTATPTTTAVPDPTPGPELSSSASPAATGTPAPSASPDDGLTLADELARTGLGTALGVLAAAVLLLAAGSALVLVGRRR